MKMVLACAVLLMTVSACGQEVRRCRTPAPSFLTCLSLPDGGFSNEIAAPVVGKSDSAPTVSPDWGCHFEVDAGQLVLVPDGQLCDREGYDDTDVKFTSRRCAVPEGTWRLTAGSTALSIAVTDAGTTCSISPWP